MSSIPPRIILPFVSDNHQWDETHLEFFYDFDQKLLLPPGLFNHCINRILPRLTTTQVDPDDGSSRTVLTEAGNQWTDNTFKAYPFFDREQRDEMSRPYVKYEKNDENKLRYALLVQTYFGTTKNECLKFANHIYAALQAEVVRRCKQDGKTLPNGDPPATISDVLTILKTSEMVETFKTDKAEVYNCIFRWIKSVTFEENLSWVKDAIEDYFKENGMLVRLARGQTKTTRRHSLVRLAVEKGTQSTKEKFKEMEAKTFGWVLQMDKKVDRYSKSQGKLNTYLKRMASDQYDTVHLDPSIVPKSRQKYPVYWLEKVGTTGEDIEPDIGAMLDVIIDTVSSGDSVTIDELVELFQEKIEKLGASTSARHQRSTGSNPEDLLEDSAGQNEQNESGNSVLPEQEEPLKSMEDRMNNLFVSHFAC